MNYVLLDLEWNTSFSKKHSKYINEIIEIGAVKLNESFEIVSTFDVMVKSQLTDKLCLRFKSLTNISNEQMLQGLSFEEALNSYTEWVGDNAITMTWSDSDLYALFDNCRFLLGINSIPCIKNYIDLQPYVQNYLKSEKGIEIKSQISLQNAAGLINIETDDISLHRACDDSIILSRILKATFNKEKLMEYLKDTTDPKFYSKMLFKPYIISDINSNYVNKRNMKFYCDKCHCRATKITKWEFKGHSFRAVFKCPQCNDEFTGCVTFKKQFDRIAVRRYKAPTGSDLKETESCTE